MEHSGAEILQQILQEIHWSWWVFDPFPVQIPGLLVSMRSHARESPLREKPVSNGFGKAVFERGGFRGFRLASTTHCFRLCFGNPESANSPSNGARLTLRMWDTCANG